MLCVGLDPDPERMPESVLATPRPYFEFCRAIVDATASHACAFKPQFAHFAAAGREDELADLMAYIRDRHPGVIAILDAKRGDVGSTAAFYAREAFDRYGADAVTVNPYLGYESIAPFLEYREQGIIVLCRTSNADSDWLQARKTRGRPVYLEVAERVAGWNEHGQCMLVTGATYPEELGTIRRVVGDMPLLVPGIGAQGGDLKAVLAQGVDGHGTGLVISSSRGIIYAAQGDDYADAAARAAEALKREINDFNKYYNNNV